MVVAVEIWIQTIYYLGLCHVNGVCLLKRQTPGTQKKKSPFLSLGTGGEGSFQPTSLRLWSSCLCQYAKMAEFLTHIMMVIPNLPWISQGCFLPPSHRLSCHFPNSKKFISSPFHLSLLDSDSESLSLLLF